MNLIVQSTTKYTKTLLLIYIRSKHLYFLKLLYPTSREFEFALNAILWERPQHNHTMSTSEHRSLMGHSAITSPSNQRETTASLNLIRSHFFIRSINFSTFGWWNFATCINMNEFYRCMDEWKVRNKSKNGWPQKTQKLIYGVRSQDSIFLWESGWG